MEKQWIYNLRKRFSNRKSAAPDGLWEGIEAAMTKQKGIVGGVGEKAKPARIIPLWTKVTAVAVACFLLIIGVWWFRNGRLLEQTESNKEVTVNKMVSDNNETDHIIAKDEPSIDDVPQGLLYKIRSKLASVVSTNTQETTYVSLPESDDLAENANTKADVSSNESAQIGEGGKKNFNSVYHHKDSHSKGNNSSLVAKKHSKSKKKGVEFGLFGGNSTMGGSSFNSNMQTFTSIAMVSENVYASVGLLKSSNMENRVISNIDDSEVNVKHRFPLRVGISVRFKLTDRLGIETGMVYSYHSSDIMSGDEWGGYKTVRKLHYVGVPLNVSYDIWKNDFINIYAKGGGMAEFCVSGHSSTDYITGNEVTETSEESVREKRPQWSVNLAPGIQYNFNDVIGIYAEPGIAYYFDNGSGMNTIYKDKKLNFNLNVGLRFTLK